MLLIRAILLWSILSLHVVGGAALFRRLFPRESPWFGFVMPCLALIIALNFIEHFIGVSSFLWALPLTTLGSIWAILHPGLDWKNLRLPTGIFLAALAFTLAVRSLQPDIISTRDGIFDLSLLASFCSGEKVPPALNWDSDLPLTRYYAFGHYGMSVLTRLFGLDTGTGFNLSVALRGAFDCFFTAAVAWRISRQKIWITLLAPILMEGAGTGLTAYLWLTVPKGDPNEGNDIFSGLDDPTNHDFYLRWLHDGCRDQLFPPGVLTWIGAFHSHNGGQFLILFFLWSLAEVLRRKPANWPWICLGTIPLLTIVTCTWALPLEGLLLLGAFFWIFYCRLHPASFRFVALGVGLAAALLAPAVLAYLTTGIFYGAYWTPPECRTQWIQLLVQWWPIWLPWLLLVPAWSRLSPVLKTIVVFLPIAFIIGDVFTVADRLDWTTKFYSFVFSIGWVALVPAVSVRRTIPFRALTLVLILSSFCSFWAWGSFNWRLSSKDDFLHLEGTGPYHTDPVLATLLETLHRVHGKIVLTGKPDDGSDAPPLAAFTGNRIYLGWSGSVNVLQSGTYSPDITRERKQQVNDFYDGKSPNPLLFLRTHDIAAVVIFPDDKISTGILDGLKKQLAPYYAYVDCRVDEGSPAGIFFFHPEMLKWPPAVLMPRLNPALPSSGTDQGIRPPSS